MRSNRIRTALAIVVALLSLGLIAGCGSKKVETNNKYVDQVNAAQNEFAATASKLKTDFSSPEKLAASLQPLIDGFKQVADKLAAIKPPNDVKAAHATLVAGLRTYVAKLTDAVAKVKSAANPAAAAAAAQAVVTATTAASAEFSKNIDAINAILKKA